MTTDRDDVAGKLDALTTGFEILQQESTQIQNKTEGLLSQNLDSLVELEGKHTAAQVSHRMSAMLNSGVCWLAADERCGHYTGLLCGQWVLSEGVLRSLAGYSVLNPGYLRLPPLKAELSVLCRC